MNKLNKVGLSALCGSLATIVGAQAGEISVSGGATATWQSFGGSQTGNPIGMNSGLTFKGSGELDGGQTFSLTLTHADKAAWSAGSLALTTNSFGKIRVALADGGSGIDAYDDKMPSAWEETWGTGLGTGIDLISGVGASTNIEWKLPTMYGMTLSLAYAGANDGVANNDKASSGGGASAFQSGYDAMLNINPTWAGDAASGLNLFVGGSETNQEMKSIGLTANDKQEVVAGFTYAIGPVTAGWQRTGEFGGETAVSKLDYYDNESFGVSFNVNDDLSISYGELESTKKVTGTPGVTTTVESIQLAYTMGGASIKIAETDLSNGTYSTAASADQEATTVALTLAF